MEYAALTAWLATATLGAYMLGREANGPRDPAGRVHSSIPVTLLLWHPLLAVSGLAVWGVFLASDDATLAWVAFADLLLVALLGDVMLLKWRRSRNATVRGTGTPYAESRLGGGVVATHGVLAATTIGLVLYSAVTA